MRRIVLQIRRYRRISSGATREIARFLFKMGGEGLQKKKEINVCIGNRIRAAREWAGLTQDQFGEMVSLGTKNVSDIERGVVGITVSTLKRICETLSIPSDWILFGDEEWNDVEYLTGRLARLSPNQFAAVKDFLNHVFELFGKIG